MVSSYVLVVQTRPEGQTERPLIDAKGKQFHPLSDSQFHIDNTLLDDFEQRKNKLSILRRTAAISYIIPSLHLRVVRGWESLKERITDDTDDDTNLTTPIKIFFTSFMVSVALGTHC